MKRANDKLSGQPAEEAAATGASPERFILGLLAATVQPEERQRSLNWQRRIRIGGSEYVARVRFEGLALYVTLAEDKLGFPVGLQVELRRTGIVPSRPGRADEVVRTYELDTGESAETLSVLLDAVQSQVAAADQAAGRPMEDRALMVRSDVGAEEAAVLEGYLGFNLNAMMEEALAGVEDTETQEEDE